MSEVNLYDVRDNFILKKNTSTSSAIISTMIYDLSSRAGSVCV